MTFAAGVDMTIFGKNLYLSIALKLSSRQSIIDSLLAGSDSATSWYKDKMNKKIQQTLQRTITITRTLLLTSSFQVIFQTP